MIMLKTDAYAYMKKIFEERRPLSQRFQRVDNLIWQMDVFARKVMEDQCIRRS